MIFFLPKSYLGVCYTMGEEPLYIVGHYFWLFTQFLFQNKGTVLIFSKERKRPNKEYHHVKI